MTRLERCNTCIYGIRIRRAQADGRFDSALRDTFRCVIHYTGHVRRKSATTRGFRRFIIQSDSREIRVLKRFDSPLLHRYRALLTFGIRELDSSDGNRSARVFYRFDSS